MKRFRGGLVFQAHRLVHHSTLGLRVIKKKKGQIPPRRLHHSRRTTLPAAPMPPARWFVLVSYLSTSSHKSNGVGTHVGTARDPGLQVWATSLETHEAPRCSNTSWYGRKSCMREDNCISHKVFVESFCRSQLPHKSVPPGLGANSQKCALVTMRARM